MIQSIFQYMNANMNTPNQWWIWLSVVSASLNLLTVIAWHFSLPIYTWVFMILFPFLVLAGKLEPQKILPIIIFFCILSIVAIGEPLADWDARSIWFFHARRIFFSAGYETQLANYAPFSHNDYPVLVPALAAALSSTIGYWSDSLVKLSLVVALLPAVFLAAYCFNATLLSIWLSGLIFISGRFLLNGYMDAIIGIYFACIVIFFANFLITKHTGERSEKPPLLQLIAIALISTSLVLTKNEGLLMVLSLMLAAIVFSKDFGLRVAGFLIIGLVIYALSWKIHVSLAGIASDTVTSTYFEVVTQRVGNFSDWLLLISVPANNIGLALCVVVLLANSFRLNRFTSLFALIITIYLAGIIMVYAGTPHQLEWHISNSANRTMLPINMLLFSFTLLIIRYQGSSGPCTNNGGTQNTFGVSR